MRFQKNSSRRLTTIQLIEGSRLEERTSWPESFLEPGTGISGLPSVASQVPVLKATKGTCSPHRFHSTRRWDVSQINLQHYKATTALISHWIYAARPSYTLYKKYGFIVLV